MPDNRKIGELTDIWTTSGTAQDGPGQYRGFVTIRAVAGDGSVLLGQLSPDECRAMAMGFLQTAEAADQDRIVMGMLIRLGLRADTAANFILDMRKERDKTPPPPEES